jgi:nucleoside 2-deoxyribosyltransferase
MKSVYIAGPYTGTKEEEHKNMMKAAAAAAFYVKQGFAVFCPHTMTCPIDRNYNTGGEIKYEDWLAIDLYWLAKCDIVAFLPGWENSKGASIEHMVARALGKEIEYVRDKLHAKEEAGGWIE